MQFGEQFRAGLRGNLTMEEQQRLSSLITPELAQLCVKAFGPEIAPMFEPYLKDDMLAQGVDPQQVGIQSLQGRY